ncbi:MULTISPECIES: encapsulin [unclassified Streptomyces]|uniref:encapsulin n=1 Tax=unclassified Streptomyces TaxID=2593676 RepID=UPI002B1CCC3F|nr:MULTISPECIES: family 1 encapsulin nanocompartment shell protein [unclassified Streptomyces]
MRGAPGSGGSDPFRGVPFDPAGPGLAAVDGLRARSSNPVLSLPAEPRDCPDAVSRALTSLRLAGIDGPYTLPLGTDEYRAVSETSDHGCPIAAHLDRMPDGARSERRPSAVPSSCPPAAATSN